MKFISAVFLSVFLAVACIAKPAVEELIFRYAPSFYDETAITLERHPDGKIFCSVSSRPECSDEQGKRPWTKLKEMEITTDVFAQISSAYEDPELQIAAEKTRDSGLDGSTWTFWKKKGSRELSFSFWSPDARREGRGAALVIELGRKFTAAAAMDDLFNPKKTPNQAPLPMPMSVTPPARQEARQP